QVVAGRCSFERSVRARLEGAHTPVADDLGLELGHQEEAVLLDEIGDESTVPGAGARRGLSGGFEHELDARFDVALLSRTDDRRAHGATFAERAEARCIPRRVVAARLRLVRTTSVEQLRGTAAFEHVAR